MRRMILGMSQSKLGEFLGVTFQQIQKYENGSNRISVHRLGLTARTLEVSPSYCLDGMIAPLTPSRAKKGEICMEWPPKMRH
jgi:transcriptional regulator with XRE-family HTH domain